LLSLVNEFSSAINQPLELKGILQTAVDDLTRVLNVAQTGLALFDQQRQHLTVVAENSAPGSHPSVGTELPIAGNLSMERILATRKYLYVGDAQHDPLLENIREIMILRQVFSILIVPLVVREEVIGTIGFDAIGAKRIFTNEEIGLAETIANLMAVRIEQARLLEELQRQAIVDELTRIYNYPGLLEHGAREIERARRFKRPLSAFFFDIDNFKDFNNRYSHTVGNLVLQAVSQCCCTITRTVDLVARYGGDEFVILLPEADLASARQVAERLRKAIEATRVTTEWGELGVTISLGVAEYEPGMVDLVALMDRANRAEHQAKELGRNRVEIAI
jgi:diguanylate cyclase (GGDEF)-like protein